MELRFDRGTLVTERCDEASPLGDLPGMRWDPRAGVFRAPASAARRIDEELVRRGVRSAGQNPDSVRSAGQELDGVRSAGPAGGWEDIALRPYQAEALAAWERAGRAGIVVLPTGSGKTHVALAAMARVQRPTLCLVPTRVLLDQWDAAIRACWSGPVGRYGDGEARLAPITVATFESAYRHMDRIGDRFGLIVIDEVHHFGRGMRDEALEMTTAGRRLGLTATPPREPEVRARLASLVGEVVFALAVSDLAGRFLAPYEHVVLRVALTAGERELYDACMRTFRPVHAAFLRAAPAATWQAFTMAAQRTFEGRQAIAAWRRSRELTAFSVGKRAALADILARHRAARVLVFTGDNASAYAVAREHLIMPITCDIGRAERDEALARFRSGELRALVSARVLNEGVDVPDAEVAVIVDGSHGERELVQRVGRVLRPGPSEASGAPGKRAVIYELVAAMTADAGRAQRRRAGLARNVADPRS